MLPWQIQFGLFRFRSPLLAESRVDFSSSSYSDASLRTVRSPKRKARESKERPHSEILGSTVACTYPRLIAACHVLHHFSSRVIRQPASLHFYQVHHITIAAPETLREHFRKPLCISSIVRLLFSNRGAFLYPLHDGHCRFPCCVLHSMLTHGTA